MTKAADGPRLTGVPAIVSPGPPAEIVVPAIENAVGFGVKTWFPTVKAVGYSFVTLAPMIKLPEGPKLTGVPAIVTPWPPADNVVPAIENAIGLGVKAWPPTVKTGGEAPLGRIVVLVPMTRLPEGPKLTDVPDIVTPGPSADRVVPAIENAIGCGVKTRSPAVNDGCEGSGGSVRIPIADPGIFIPG